ncbi:hypothetical protein GCM10010384_34770 [Streptomyces djakartensis]|uniref:Uncharacterized protein n=1 Tax=Streptomyces djakartensis TaxID=68193 RepID=A0ABQ2ZT74_9ACTN|nr:hypothetical protein GCM10010384_34770 [Streptomyces djakartensis]
MSVGPTDPPGHSPRPSRHGISDRGTAGWCRMSAAEALTGLLAVFLLTACTGYFVAQEFAYV